MTDTDERPGIEERYATACSAPDLRVRETSAPIDVIIAAGMVGDSLGSLLCRLRAEFDRVRGERGRHQSWDATAKALVLLSLPSLESARVALGSIALKHSVLREERLAADLVMRIAGRCLDLFLDPNCPKCEGRGYNGAGRGIHQGLQVNCRSCGGTATEQGSGERARDVGRDPSEREFGRQLLEMMNTLAANAPGQIAQRMK